MVTLRSDKNPWKKNGVAGTTDHPGKQRPVAVGAGLLTQYIESNVWYVPNLVGNYST